MKTKIPSPVLARIQLMFQSGATLEEVTEALGLDTSWQNEPQPAPQRSVQDMTPVAVPPPVAQPANDIQMPRLKELSGKLEEHVTDLLKRDDVRDVPTISGSLDAIYQLTSAIGKEIAAGPAKVANNQRKLTNENANPKVAKPAVKQAAPINKPAKSEAPAPIQVRAPKPQSTPAPAATKKVAPPREKLKPTGELPAAAKRRAAAHPFAASLTSDADAPSVPAPKAAPTIPKAAPILSADNPSSQYRDRIAAAMNQISTIAEQHERDDDYIAVRHS